MKISYNWLKNYIDIDLTPEDTARILTDIGLEVEGIEKYEQVKGGMKGLVIGKVLTCEKHPNADKLSVTTVDAGTGEPLHIVCGAPNVAAGQKVVVATVGTELYHNDESFTIKKAKIRGELSEGMICAEDEIGMGTGHDGIIVLDENAKTGTPASDYFKISTDMVFEIGLTPNRIDSASHFGTARDLAAFLKQTRDIQVNLPDIGNFHIENNSYPVEVMIENPDACNRYAGVTVKGVTIKPSPQWLQNRLRSIGLNPINNVVDITNFVLHELGQPLHAFDADHLKGSKIVVKNLPQGTKFVTLDEIERELSAEDLMICDGEGPVAIAGVFGGLHSGVTSETKNVFIESAYFSPVSVRKTAKLHGLSTDASFRFERGVDPEMILVALKRAALLMKEIAGGEIASEIVDVYPVPVNSATVKISFENVTRLIGKDISADRIKKILLALEMKILEENSEGLILSVPAYRVDVNREADVIEEILRIYGYNNVEISEKLNANISYVTKPDREKLVNTVSDYLSNNSFNEIMSNSLTNTGYYKELQSFRPGNAVKILNPISVDLDGMRQTLLFGGLEAIAYNTNRRNANLKLYELGNCYFYQENNKTSNPLDKYNEEMHLALFLSGLVYEPNWVSPEKESSFFLLKAYTENILKRLGTEINQLEKKTTEKPDIFEDGITYSSGKYLLAEIGIVKKQLCNQFDIDADVFYADLNWEKIIQHTKDHRISYQPLPKFPEVKRDFSLLIDRQITYDQIEKLAYETERKLLKRINLFDVYFGEKIADDKKSYAVSFILQDENKTLTDKEIDKTMDKLARAFTDQLKAVIR